MAEDEYLRAFYLATAKLPRPVRLYPEQALAGMTAQPGAKFLMD
jgi:hypothetical protein